MREIFVLIFLLYWWYHKFTFAKMSKNYTHTLCQYQFPRFDIIKWILYSFFIVSVTTAINLVALNNANLLSHGSSVGQKSGHSTAQLILCSRFHGAKIKVLTGLNSFLEVLG